MILEYFFGFWNLVMWWLETQLSSLKFLLQKLSILASFGAFHKIFELELLRCSWLVFRWYEILGTYLDFPLNRFSMSTFNSVFWLSWKTLRFEREILQFVIKPRPFWKDHMGLPSWIFQGRDQVSLFLEMIWCGFGFFFLKNLIKLFKKTIQNGFYIVFWHPSPFFACLASTPSL
jgi:hypothetical protein